METKSTESLGSFLKYVLKNDKSAEFALKICKERYINHLETLL